MTKIRAKTLKRNCLQIMEQVGTSGRPILVTKGGKPLVKIVPAEFTQSIFGFMAAEFTIVGDVESPIWGK